MSKTESKTPRADMLRELLKRHGIGPCMWSERGPVNTGVDRLECYSWPRARTVCIVQTFTGRGHGRRKAGEDIGGFEIFAPVSNANDVADMDSEMTAYESRNAERAPGAGDITVSGNES